jgi:ketosteroid isomerase-like protein
VLNGGCETSRTRHGSAPNVIAHLRRGAAQWSTSALVSRSAVAVCLVSSRSVASDAARQSLPRDASRAGRSALSQHLTVTVICEATATPSNLCVGRCAMDVRQTITELYRDYENRDLPKILAALPNDFVFEWHHDPSTAQYAGICRSRDELVVHLKDIGDRFQFNAYHATNILVDGNRAAAQLHLDLTSKATGQRFSIPIAHFWSFKDGIPVHLVEYMDSGLMARQSMPQESDAPSPVRA